MQGTCSLTCEPGNGLARGSYWSQGLIGACLTLSLLRVNDWLLRINDVDLINKDKKQAIKALLHGEGAINMVVRRRKSLGGKVVTPLHINLSGQKGSRPQMRQTPPLLEGDCVCRITLFPGVHVGGARVLSWWEVARVTR